MAEQRLEKTTTQAGVDLYGRLGAAVDGISMRPVHYKIFALVALGSLFNAIEQYNVGYAGPIIAEQWALSSTAVGLLSTATFIAMAVGSLLSGIAGDRYGRRVIFMVNLAVFAVGALLAAVAPSYETLLAARILVGLGLGGEIALGFTVVSEMMPTKRRGTMTASLSFVAGGIGVFAASGLGALVLGPMSGILGGEQLAWRWFFAIMVLPAVLILFIRRYVPETPRYLLQHGKINETNRVLSSLASNTLRPGKDFEVERFLDVPEGTRPTEDLGKVRLTDIFQGAVLRSTIVGWLLTLAMFGTIVVLTVFMSTVLVARGFEVGTSLLYTTLINFGGLLGGLVGIVAASKLPRRLTFISGAGMCAAFAVCFSFSTNAVPAVIFSFLLAFTFQVLLANLWAYLPELYPTRLRAFGTGACSTVGLLAAGLGPLAAGALMDGFGEVGVYTLVGGMCVVIAVIATVGPETQGRDLDQVV